MVDNFLSVLQLEGDRNLTVFCEFLYFSEVKLVQLHSCLLLCVVSLLDKQLLCRFGNRFVCFGPVHFLHLILLTQVR